MKLIVGLGNPGKEYEQTRHNVGFFALDTIAAKLSILNFKFSKKFAAETSQNGEILLVKPQTFMNKSGDAVLQIVNFYKIALQDLWVIHDDLDIRLGEYKIQWGKGPKVHNGLSSIESALGTKEFWRVRMGIDNRNPFGKLRAGEARGISGEDYVLSRFMAEEKPIINDVIEKVGHELISRNL